MIDTITTRINLLLTTRCNYRCDYCSVINNKYAELSVNQWMNILCMPPFSRLNNSILVLTGGEIFFYKEYLFLIKELMKKTSFKLDIATNLSFDINDLCEILDFQRVNHITAGFHPQYCKNLQIFSRRLKQLKEFKIGVNVNFVAYRPWLALLPQYKEYFERECQVPFKIIPFIGPGRSGKDIFFPDYYTKSELEFLKQFEVF